MSVSHEDCTKSTWRSKENQKKIKRKSEEDHRKIIKELTWEWKL